MTSGRFVMVKENVTSDFAQKFQLNMESNQLLGIDGSLPEESGFRGSYIVLKINAREIPDYKEFEADNEAQAIIKSYLDENLRLSEEIAESITETVKTVKSFKHVKDALKLVKNFMPPTMRRTRTL